MKQLHSSLKPAFQQLHLRDIERGLAKEFAILRLSPAQLTEMKGIQFEITKDDLGACKAALLITPAAQQFALRSYYAGPNPDRTELIGSEKSNDPEKDLDSFLRALDLPKKFIAWRIEKEKPPQNGSPIIRTLLMGVGVIGITYIFFAHTFGTDAITVVGIFAPVVLVHEELKFFPVRFCVSLLVWFICLCVLFRLTRRRPKSLKAIPPEQD